MADNSFTFLNSYCERAGDPAMWAEPLNAITNLFFILAAALAARALFIPSPVGGELGMGRNGPAVAQSGLHPTSPLQGEGKRNALDLWMLICALFAIGAGSGAWHLKPSGETVLMDVIPIALFINIYIVAALRRLYGLNWRKTIGWWAVYFAASMGTQFYLPPGLLNGTIMYVPTYAALVVITFTLAKRDQATAKIFALMTTVWSASLIFRTMDMGICPHFPIGTHFLWHTLNALVLYRLLMVLIQKPSLPHAGEG